MPSSQELGTPVLPSHASSLLCSEHWRRAQKIPEGFQTGHRQQPCRTAQSGNCDHPKELPLCRKWGWRTASCYPVFIRRNMQSERHLVQEMARRYSSAPHDNSDRTDWFSASQGRSKVANELTLIIMKRRMLSAGHQRQAASFCYFPLKIFIMHIYSTMGLAGRLHCKRYSWGDITKKQSVFQADLFSKVRNLRKLSGSEYVHWKSYSISVAYRCISRFSR